MKVKKLKQNIDEGVLYTPDKDAFIFNFNSDTKHDAIALSNADITVSKFREHVYIYGYSLRDEGINSSKFVSWLKAQVNTDNSTDNIKRFIDDAVNNLHKKYNLNDFECIVYPDTAENKLVENIIRKIHTTLYDYETPVTYYSIIKNLPEKIKFDWLEFKYDNPDLYSVSGNSEINQQRKAKRQQIEDRIHKLLSDIHAKDFFKLHESGFSVNERKYLRNFFSVSGINNYSTLYQLKDAKRVLLVDDTVTSGSTMDEMIRSIQVINPDCDITIFTLIKGKDGHY